MRKSVTIQIDTTKVKCIFNDTKLKPIGKKYE